MAAVAGSGAEAAAAARLKGAEEEEETAAAAEDEEDRDQDRSRAGKAVAEVAAAGGESEEEEEDEDGEDVFEVEKILDMKTEGVSAGCRRLSPGPAATPGPRFAALPEEARGRRERLLTMRLQQGEPGCAWRAPRSPRCRARRRTGQRRHGQLCGQASTHESCMLR